MKTKPQDDQINKGTTISEAVISALKSQQIVTAVQIIQCERSWTNIYTNTQWQWMLCLHSIVFLKNKKHQLT